MMSPTWNGAVQLDGQGLGQVVEGLISTKKGKLFQTQSKLSYFEYEDHFFFGLTWTDEPFKVKPKMCKRQSSSKATNPSVSAKYNQCAHRNHTHPHREPP